MSVEVDGVNKSIKVDTVSEVTSANGVSIDSVKLKDGTVDVNGVSDGIILDADADTTISADTDDQIDFKAGGTDTMHIINGKVGIGTTAPGDILEIDGTDPIFKVGNKIRIKADESNATAFLGVGGSINNLQFGDADFGTTALKIDFGANGAVTKPLQPAFLATVSTTQSNIADGHVQIEADNEIFDQNADYNTGNYTFTAPVTGKYSFQVNITVSDLAIDYQWVYCYVGTSNRTCFISHIDPRLLAQAGGYSLGGAILVDMDANDTATLYFRSSAHGTNTVDIVANTSNPETYFSGYLVA